MPERLDLERHEGRLAALIGELAALPDLDRAAYERILRRHPKPGSGFYSKSEIVRAFRGLRERYGWSTPEAEFLDRVRMKPVRTASGVAPVTVLTRPFPCPGKCIFCPSDVRMPKSYLADEPGAQRAAQHRFDPYAQTLARLLTYDNNGHHADKAELIVLGGTWSSYPESYQIWFVKRCFDALNDFRGAGSGSAAPGLPAAPDYGLPGGRVDGRSPSKSYNRILREFLGGPAAPANGFGAAAWSELEAAQRRNETAAARSVGLSLETRPDHLTREEVLRFRRLGATKVQIGYQSLSDEVLRRNHRGHDVAATRRAMRLLREAGFKIQAHWMPNLYGSDPRRDLEDYARIFADPDFRPDELKIYPCSLIESAELMAYWADGRWRPYTREELLEVLTGCLRQTPEYCRLTRVIRDIPGTDIVAGNRATNFREVVERELERRGERCRDIRAREIRHRPVRRSELRFSTLSYDTSIGREVFLQVETADDRLAAFLRLSLPRAVGGIGEIAGSAMIREVHVYGRLVGIGRRREGRSQHLGLGRELIERAAAMARRAGYPDLAVISSVGTREYYRSLGFGDGELYQHRPLAVENRTARPRRAVGA